MNKEIIHSTQCLFLVSVTYSVHVQGVHGEVVRVQVKGLEKLLHCYFFPLKLVHDAVGIHAVGLLDEAQQMLLVHAGCGVDVCVHLEGQRRTEETRGRTGVLTIFVHKRKLKTHRQHC